MDLASLELVQQVVDEHGLRHEERRAEELAQVRLLHTALEERQQVLGVEHADDLVDRLLVDRDPAVALADEGVDGIVDGCGDRESRHLRARNHDLMDAALAQLDDGTDHLFFLGLEDARLPSPLHDQLEFLGVDLGLACDAGTESARDDTSHPGENPHDRREDLAYDIQRAGKRQCDAVRICESEGLGDQLPKDDGETRKKDRDDQQGDAAGCTLEDGNALEGDGQTVG